MAFLRYANARFVHPVVSGQGWDNVRTAAAKAKMDRSLVDQASKILKEDFDPKNYLLSHATIVASVDTVTVKNAKLGSSVVNGKKVVRKTTSYRVKPECQKFINNNADCWSRGVLLKSYPTFIGAHNFLEHVQIEDLSKGRILDAVARDIGDSLYVDILIATSRKHRELIEAIESGELSTLSMGCSIDGSTCTKCGHWAADETEFCDHVKYEKGNLFIDELGNQSRVAELCGDESLDPTGGNTFIEASWVKIPAFKGAVRRNILTLSSGDRTKTSMKVSTAVESVSDPVLDDTRMRKAAKLSFGEEDMGGDAPAESPAAPTTSPDPLKDLEEDVKQHLLDRVRKSLKDDLDKSDLADAIMPPSASMEPNDTIVKQAGLKRAKYLNDVRRVLLASKNDQDVIRGIALLNADNAIFVPKVLYRAALKVGGTHRYASLQNFLDKCAGVLDRPPTVDESKILIRLAKLLTIRRVGVKPKQRTGV